MELGVFQERACLILAVVLRLPVDLPDFWKRRMDARMDGSMGSLSGRPICISFFLDVCGSFFLYSQSVLFYGN